MGTLTCKNGDPMMLLQVVFTLWNGPDYGRFMSGLWDVNCFIPKSLMLWFTACEYFQQPRINILKKSRLIIAETLRYAKNRYIQAFRGIEQCIVIPPFSQKYLIALLLCNLIYFSNSKLPIWRGTAGKIFRGQMLMGSLHSSIIKGACIHMESLV